MNGRRWTFLFVLLSACAQPPVLTSTLPPLAASRPPSIVGVETPALAADRLESWAAGCLAKLKARIRGKDWAAQVQLTRLPGPAVQLQINSGDWFDAGNAQMKFPALELFAEVGDVLKNDPGTVAHILVRDDAAADPSTGLGARRAAAVLEYLVSRGVPETRLRSEDRSPSSTTSERPLPTMMLILKPVVQGRETEAWVLPPWPGL
ncbi:MAG: hypothetical protein L0Y32_00940 [Nevskiales bacterium]|nr:hypothetical protein [Nevskiales bacterium]